MNLFDTAIYTNILTPDLSRYPMSHSAYLETIEPGRVMVCWFSGSREWATDVHILYSVMSVETRTWEPITELVHEVAYSLGNSVVARDPTGKLHLWYIRTKRYWQDGEVVHMTSENGGNRFDSKEVMPLPAAWLIRGRPVIRGNRVHLPVYHETELVSAVWAQNLLEPNGSMGEPVGSTGGLIQPVLVAVGDNEFRGFFRNPWTPNRMHQAYSMDRGISWSRPHATNLPNPNSGIDIIALEGDLFVCVYNDSETKRSPLSVAISRNRGIDWVKVGDLERESNEFSYPTMTMADGRIYLAYTYKRKSIKFLILDPKGLHQIADELC